MLVLSAASLHSAMKSLLEDVDLRGLLRRVTGFVEDNDYCSGTYEVEFQLTRQLEAWLGSNGGNI